MKTKHNNIEAFSGDFLYVGKHDEEELKALGPQRVENISLELDALHCLRFFPAVTNLILRPGELNEKELSFLYDLPIKRLKLDYYTDSPDAYTLDLGKFGNLETLFSRSQYGFQNAGSCNTLRALTVQEWYTSDLTYLENSSISELIIFSGKLRSLSGLRGLSSLKFLSLSNHRLLKDISGLADCPDLTHLEIDSCGKFLPETIPAMAHLQSLELIGKQTIDSCAFFSRFPKLERLILGMKIIDGDTSSLLNLKHCAFLTDHRHYTYKNADMPNASVICVFRKDNANV